MQKMLRAFLKRVVVTRVALASSLVGGSLLLLGVMVSPSPQLPISQLLGSKQLAALQSAASGQVISANPNPIVVCDGSGLGVTTLSWTLGTGVTYEVHSGTADGPVLAQGQGPSSTQLIGVANGQQYFLVKLTTRTTYTYKKVGKKYVRTPITTTTRTTVGSTTITVTTQGCSTPPPAQGQASFVFQTTSLPAATVGTYYSTKISFQYHTTGVNYATNATFTGLPNGITTGSSSGPNTTYGILPGLEGPNGQASVTISGTPTTAGTNTVTLALTDQYGTNASTNFILVVQPNTSNNPPPPTAQVRVGQLVRSISGSDNGTVYLVGDRGLISFATVSIFNSWCFQFSQVVPANAAEMALPRIAPLDTPRQSGQTLPPGVSVLLASTCGNQTPPPPVLPPLSCTPDAATVTAGQPIRITANGGSGAGTYYWAASDADPYINHLFADTITTKFQVYSDGLTPYAYTTTITVYSGTQSAQCTVRITPPAIASQPTALNPNAACSDTNYIHPAAVFPNIAGDTQANAQKLVDGDTNTVWTGPATQSGYWVTYDFGDQYKVTKLCINPKFATAMRLSYGTTIYDDYAHSNDPGTTSMSTHHFPSAVSAPNAWITLPVDVMGRYARVFFSPSSVDGGTRALPQLAFAEIHFVGAEKNSSYQLPASTVTVPDVIYICAATGGAGTDMFAYTVRSKTTGSSTISSTAEGYNNVALGTGPTTSIQLGTNNTVNTYTFRFSDGTTGTMKTMPEPGPCVSTTEYQFDIAANNGGVLASAVVSFAPAGYQLQPTDGIAGVYTNTITNQQTVLPFAKFKTSVNLNQFIAETDQFILPASGHVLYTMTFNGKVLQKEY